MWIKQQMGGAEKQPKHFRNPFKRFGADALQSVQRAGITLAVGVSALILYSALALNICQAQPKDKTYFNYEVNGWSLVFKTNLNIALSYQAQGHAYFSIKSVSSDSASKNPLDADALGLAHKEGNEYVYRAKLNPLDSSKVKIYVNDYLNHDDHLFSFVLDTMLKPESHHIKIRNTDLYLEDMAYAKQAAWMLQAINRMATWVKPEKELALLGYNQMGKQRDILDLVRGTEAAQPMAQVIGDDITNPQSKRIRILASMANISDNRAADIVASHEMAHVHWYASKNSGWSFLNNLWKSEIEIFYSDLKQLGSLAGTCRRDNSCRISELNGLKLDSKTMRKLEALITIADFSPFLYDNAQPLESVEECYASLVSELRHDSQKVFKRLGMNTLERLRDLGDLDSTLATPAPGSDEENWMKILDLVDLNEREQKVRKLEFKLLQAVVKSFEPVEGYNGPAPFPDAVYQHLDMKNPFEQNK